MTYKEWVAGQAQQRRLADEWATQSARQLEDYIRSVTSNN